MLQGIFFYTKEPLSQFFVILGLGVPQQPIKKECSLAEEETQSEVCEISHQSIPELEVAQTLDEWEVTCKGGGGETKTPPVLNSGSVYYV